MTNIKSLLCIVGGIFVMMCAVFYGIFFLLYPMGTAADPMRL